ncbi:hypothetical protein [Uliginosibacterium sp. H1]|uniref:hypothetical protein n=1 Tax=Uliginosibacterium sp. H1 TaxID=3114757 RepID=UPI002E19E055|nr:hypothetical protein [Uliginosibacterium sp. H1]
MFHLRTLLFALLVFASPAVLAAPVLLVQSGEFVGADSVDVSGTLYDVRFVDGSCNALFAGCTSFTFTDFASADAASHALFALLTNAGDPSFYVPPPSVRGCEDPSMCHIVTPFGLNAAQDWVFNQAHRLYEAYGLPQYGFGQVGGVLPSIDTTSSSLLVYAVWAPSRLVDGEVPEPQGVALAGIGIIALLMSRRRKQGSA